jgi:hypothetical protein
MAIKDHIRHSESYTCLPDLLLNYQDSLSAVAFLPHNLDSCTLSRNSSLCCCTPRTYKLPSGVLGSVMSKVKCMVQRYHTVISSKQAWSSSYKLAPEEVNNIGVNPIRMFHTRNLLSDCLTYETCAFKQTAELYAVIFSWYSNKTISAIKSINILSTQVWGSNR